MSAKDRWTRYNAKPETKQAKHDWYVANKQQVLASQREKYATDPEFAERKRNNSSRRYTENIEQIKEYRAMSETRIRKAASDARYYAKPEKHAAVRKHQQTRKYTRLYGLTTEQIDQMIADRHGLCDICHKPAQHGSRLNVDHNHATGAVRGMLCWSCNVGIGKLGDSIEVVRSALDYLKQAG